MALSKGWRIFLPCAALVVLDQVTKILVKTNMVIGESIPVIGDFLRVCFVENEGMAFGFLVGGIVGKILLTVFRLVLFVFLWWWICKSLRTNETVLQGKAADDAKPVPFGVLMGLGVIAAGAFGNIIDCVLYGQIFSASGPMTIASFGGSYAPIGMGKVVDMISFSIFPPVFNVADSCVTCGAAYLVLFQWKYFSGK